MQLKKSLFIISSAVMLSATMPAAMAASEKHIVIAPQCLLDTANITFKTLSTKKTLRLIEVDDAGIQQLAANKHKSKTLCGGFMDVTRDWQNKNALVHLTPASFLDSYKLEKVTPAKKVEYKIQHEKETENVLKTINPQNMWTNLTTLTSFKDRYANSKTGVAAAEWIKQQVETMAKETGHTDVTVYYVATGNWKQPSVVAKVGNSNEPGIVIGGHMDTLNASFGNMPGADDDGSGSVTVMETARTILASGVHFNKPIYFIWYSAEEMGLVGSDYVVADFKKKHIPVAAALQLDMDGYAPHYDTDPTMWLVTDYVNKDLTAFLEKLITTYVKKPYKFTKCGYACSDHASWYQGGVASAFPFESKFNEDDPYIHSANDKMEALELRHMTDYLKLATAFAVELAEPVSKK